MQRIYSERVTDHEESSDACSGDRLGGASPDSLLKTKQVLQGVKMKRFLFLLSLFFIFSISFPFSSFAEGNRSKENQVLENADSAKEKVVAMQKELNPMEYLKLSPAEFIERYQEEEAEMKDFPRKKACGCSVAPPLEDHGDKQ